MKAFKIVEEDGQFVTYRFKTIYIYILYLAVAILFVGAFSEIAWVTILGVTVMGIYFFTVSIPNYSLFHSFRRARLEEGIEISGSKWSFSNPLEIKVRKSVPE